MKTKVLIFIIALLWTGLRCLHQGGTFLNYVQVSTPFVDEINDAYNEKGDGIRIAILDSGLFTKHVEFSNVSQNGYNFIDSSKDIDDDNGHGTWITGIISADNNAFGIQGVAPSATVIPLKVLDKYGRGDIETVCAAIEWCISNNVDIINLSFTTKEDNTHLFTSIKKALSAGIVVVSSYNNDTAATHCYPADYEGVIGVKVGNKNRIEIRDHICYAPGSETFTTNIGGGYCLVGGTSIATAYVTGLIALSMEHCKKSGQEFTCESFFQEWS